MPLRAKGWLSGALLACLTVMSAAQPALATEDGGFTPYHVQGNVWLMAGGPGETNVIVQVGDDGVLVVDTGVRPLADQLLAAILRLSENKPIRMAVNTSMAADHTGGNESLRLGGRSILGGNQLRESPFITTSARLLAHSNALARMSTESSGGNTAVPSEQWPTETYNGDLYSFTLNGEAVQLLHPHLASTDGDTMVMFRRSDVLATGDVLNMVTYPTIDVAHGGSIDGVLVALNKIIEIAVPADKAEGGTLIVPGHGRVCDQYDVVVYRNMLTLIRNRIQYYKSQGKTLPQVLALKPTGDFDARWGGEGGASVARQFVEAVYATLPAKGPSFSMHTMTIVPAGAKAPGGRAY